MVQAVVAFQRVEGLCSDESRKHNQRVTLSNLWSDMISTTEIEKISF